MRMEVRGAIFLAARGARSWRRARGADRMREAIVSGCVVFVGGLLLMGES